jgi:hypothetical protein
MTELDGGWGISHAKHTIGRQTLKHAAAGAMLTHADLERAKEKDDGEKMCSVVAG